MKQNDLLVSRSLVNLCGVVKISRWIKESLKTAVNGEHYQGYGLRSACPSTVKSKWCKYFRFTVSLSSKM